MSETFEVVRGFATRTRRFLPGQQVTAADLDGGLTVEDWARLGCLRAPESKGKAAKIVPAEPPAD
jgi:hypothetical protein